MKRVPAYTRRTFLAVAGALAASAAARPSMLYAAQPLTVSLGTATPGGGFQLYGATLAAAVAQADTGLTIDASATGGSRDNLELLREGKLDFGQVEGNAAQQAFEAQSDSAAKLMVAAAMYPGPGMFVVRGDSDARTIADLEGKRVIFGTQKSGLTILVKSVLSGLGYDPEKDFRPVYLDRAGDGPPMVLNGEVAAYWGGGFGWPGFVKVSQGEKGARFIVPGADGIGRIRARYPYLQEMEVPAGSYPGIGEDLATVGLWSFILTRPDLPEERARAFAEAVHKAGPGLADKLEQGRYTTPENTARYAPEGLLHPGARAYLKQIGVID